MVALVEPFEAATLIPTLAFAVQEGAAGVSGDDVGAGLDRSGQLLGADRSLGLGGDGGAEVGDGALSGGQGPGAASVAHCGHGVAAAERVVVEFGGGEPAGV